jgi:hypothetical protein
LNTWLYPWANITTARITRRSSAARFSPSTPQFYSPY